MTERRLAPWGLMLPNFDPFEVGELPVAAAAKQAEEGGFDAVWVGDHLAFHPPILEATMALSVAATVTTRVRLGSAVLLAPLRRPVWLAKSLQTLSHLAPGRVIAGFGVGGEHPPEWRAAGEDVGGRGKRLDEFLELLPRLLGGDAVVHAGALEIDTPPLRPACPVPPIAIGGRSDAAISRAARFGDQWLTVWMDPSAIRAAGALLAEAASAAGRPTPETTMVMFAGVGDDRAGLVSDAERLFRGQYDLPFEVVADWTQLGTVEQVAEGFQRYVDAGVTGFVIIPTRPDVLAQTEALAEVRSLLRF